MLTGDKAMTTVTMTNASSPLARVRALAAWPFTNRYASPIWFALRLYLGWIFMQFGWRKLEAGWLTSDPMGTVIGQIAAGKLPVSFAPFRDFCAFLMDAGLTPYLSMSMPFMELAVGLSFFSGILVVPAAVGASILLVNFILSGIGTLAFEGRILLGLVLLMLAYRVVSVIGLQELTLRILGAAAAHANIRVPGRLAKAPQR
jgi:thiosulfate dehydrogenase (quinone) large subunit